MELNPDRNCDYLPVSAVLSIVGLFVDELFTQIYAFAKYRRIGPLHWISIWLFDRFFNFASRLHAVD